MHRLGFDEGWMNLIMKCISTVKYKIKVNGDVTETITPQRGLRQGDPLSPYLFLLCAEGFSAMLHNAERIGLIRGIKICRGAPSVSHLLFADDSIVFLEGSKDSLLALKEILGKYEAASGQKVNLQKSSIFFGKGCPEGRKEVFRQVIGIETEALGERYLGLPTVVGRSKEGTFKHLTESSKGKVSGWKGQGLSKAAREVLVKSVLQATPTYTMSCIQLTKKMCRKLTSISSKFWWGAANGERKCTG